MHVLQEESPVGGVEVNYQRRPAIVINSRVGTDASTNEKAHLQLPLHKVEASDHLRDRVFNL